METVAIIVAAGQGNRAGGGIPKQYVKSKNTRMLTLTIKAFLKSDQIGAIIVVINRLDELFYSKSIKTINDSRLLKPCFGGAERSDSVKNGLDMFEARAPKNVLIHDAARPFVSEGLINKIIKELKTHKAVLPALSIVDAIWEIRDKKATFPQLTPGPDRNNLLLAQTPQGFDFKTILSAYNNFNSSAFDDITVAYKAGVKIKTIIGDNRNKKVTSVEDLNDFKGIKK